MCGLRRRATFYIAARVSARKGDVKHITVELKSRGHTPAFDWTQTEVPKPYADYPTESAVMADQMLAAASYAELVIFLADDDGLRGALCEFGVARLSLSAQPWKRIVIVNLGLRDSIMFHHPRITHVEGLPGLSQWIEANVPRLPRQ